ncbi:MAG: DnaJ domain-containing protein [Woeseiaceae bacterium]|nr:DnaJ domain-containing protein [Woeseiaceae bacterium]
MQGAHGERNYYEVLEIDRCATPAGVQAAYRRLMQRPGLHPDRGGDHVTAALINRAYSVLRDPVERAAYDHRLDILARVAAGFSDDVETAATACAFCAAIVALEADDREAACEVCGSPLAPAGAQRIEPDGQRAIARCRRNLDLVYFTDWRQGRARRARTEDISLSGLRLSTRHEVVPGQRIRIVSSVLEAVGRVTHAETRGPFFSARTVAGVAFVTLRLSRTTGGFLSRHV